MLVRFKYGNVVRPERPQGLREAEPSPKRGNYKEMFLLFSDLLVSLL